jgi:hypothetical protein
VLSFLAPQKQEELLSIWESAIEKTGGYFYSRLLLATINGGLFYVMLRILGVPGPPPSRSSKVRSPPSSRSSERTSRPSFRS